MNSELAFLYTSHVLIPLFAGLATNDGGAGAVMVLCSSIGPAVEVTATLRTPLERHNSIVQDGLIDLRKRSDVVVPAQASMLRVVGQLPLNGGSPILSSPELAVRRMREVLPGALAVSQL